MTRRACLGYGTLVCALLGKRRSALAQTRLSLTEAAYQPTPNGLQSCGTCTLFIRPDACKVVAGEVSRTGWCRLYDMAD